MYYEGTEAADTLVGNAYANHYLGLGGDDTINGVDGNNVLEGGDGNDSLTGAMATISCREMPVMMCW